MGDDGGKRNPPVGRPTRDLADLWIFKVRKICPSPNWGHNEARSDTCKRIAPPYHFLRPRVPLPDDVISVDGLRSTYRGRFRVWTDSRRCNALRYQPASGVTPLSSRPAPLPCHRAPKADSDLSWLLGKTIRLIGFAQSGHYLPQYLMSTTKLSEHLANPSSPFANHFNLQPKNPKMKILQSIHAIQWVSAPELPPKALQQIH